MGSGGAAQAGEAASAPSSTDIRYLIPLIGFTLSTGIVDAVSYLSLDYVFTANMTGNVLFIGFDIGGANAVHWINVLLALVCFSAGVILCARIVRRRQHASRMPTANLVMLAAAAVVVLALAGVWVTLGTIDRTGVLVVTGVLAACMGMQAAGVRGAGIREINTIVVTIAFANLAYDSRLAGASGERWGRRALSVLALAAGAMVGAFVVRVSVDAVALVIAGLVMLACVGLMAYARRVESQGSGR